MKYIEDVVGPATHLTLGDISRSTPLFKPTGKNRRGTYSMCPY
jgi:hypothetical protein